MHGLFALVHDFKSTVHASTEVTLRAYSRASLRAIRSTFQSSTKRSLECMACLLSCMILRALCTRVQKSRYEHTREQACVQYIVHFNRALSGRSSAWLVTSILASKLASVLVILDGRVTQMVACGLLRACSWLKFQASFINYKLVL